MTTNALSPSATATPAMSARPWRWLWTGGAIAASAAASVGGAPGIAAAAVAALCAAFAVRGGAASAAPAVAPAVAGRSGAEVMVSQVVPVWSRQLDTTREAANDGVAQLLEVFAAVSGTLEELARGMDGTALAMAPGAADEALASQAPAINALIEPSQRAFRERDAAHALLARCEPLLAELQRQAKHAREIARHTRLVAFNASVEAQRGNAGTASGGAQTVPTEVRMLADRMAETGEAIDAAVTRLHEPVQAAVRDGRLHDTSHEELRLEIEIRAREALGRLVAALGSSLSSSREMRERTTAMRDRIDSAFVQFQFGDRVSQMLSIVANDMSRFAEWVAAHPQATQNDAAEWLLALEQSYTMDEQRAQHHGNVHIERSSGVDFF